MKQVRILQVSALLLMAMSLSACVEVTRTLAFDGKKVVETRNLKGFEEIEIRQDLFGKQRMLKAKKR